MCTNSVKKIVQKVFQKMYQQKPWCFIGIFKRYDRFPSLRSDWKILENPFKKQSLINIPKKPSVPISNSILPCLEFSRQKARPPARCERRTRVSSITLAEVHGFKILMEQILWQISSQIHPSVVSWYDLWFHWNQIFSSETQSGYNSSQSPNSSFQSEWCTAQIFIARFFHARLTRPTHSWCNLQSSSSGGHCYVQDASEVVANLPSLTKANRSNYTPRDQQHHPIDSLQENVRKCWEEICKSWKNHLQISSFALVFFLAESPKQPSSLLLAGASSSQATPASAETLLIWAARRWFSLGRHQGNQKWCENGRFKLV